MLQRYDISMDQAANRLSIEEYAKDRKISKNPNSYASITDGFSLMYKTSYNGDLIRAAMREGINALISVLRSCNFFPARVRAEIIAAKVIEILKDNSAATSELFFDDNAIAAQIAEN